MLKIDPGIVGRELEPVEREVSAEEIMNYAAAVGDDNPRYLDDSRAGGVAAPPLFAVAASWPVIKKFQERLRAEIPPPVVATSVHASERIEFHRLIRPGDRLCIGARIVALYPTAAGAAMVIRLEAAEAAGRPVFTEHGGALFRGVGCAGPGRGLENLPKGPSPPEELERPLWEVEIPIARSAPHVYSACSGIVFPIHTSAAFAKSAGLPDIILHGTATLALAAREILNREAGGEPARLEEISCRFTGLVIPGSSIRVQLLGKEKRGEELLLAFSVQNGQGRPALRWGLARLGPEGGGAGR